ncbi:MAG: adenylyl-sulfate kinase, partial [Bacteriovoracaceae bacterium]|nr:adenylyl-sulfate kinase [Bacteriovoracaceae bacterium]
MSKNLFIHDHVIDRSAREKNLQQKSHFFLFTGLSGSGKSTVAGKFEEKLVSKGYKTVLLDGDHFRHGLSAGLGFSKEDRNENLRRVAETGKLFVGAGIIVLAAFVS